MNNPSPKIALLYEHPQWSEQLLERMRSRRLNVTAIDVAATALRPADLGQYDLWVNRVNIMPSAGRSASAVAATHHLLMALEIGGQSVINGWRSHAIGSSKAAQAALFSSLGLNTPAAVAIGGAEDSLTAATELGFPVLIKPNIGGSGQGIVRFDSHRELGAVVNDSSLDLGLDGTGLVQQIVESADGFVHRVEMLGAKLFYATRQPITDGAFNYCAIDGNSVGPAAVNGDTDAGTGDPDMPSKIDIVTPPDDVVAAVGGVLRAAGCDIGGVEYLIDRETGQPTFFDFNPYSNFVVGRNHDLGFDPIDRYLEAILGRCQN